MISHFLLNMRRLCLIFYLLGIGVAYGSPDPEVRFIENKNQWKYPVQFAARVNGGRMMLLPGKFRYGFLDQQHQHELHGIEQGRAEMPEAKNLISGVVVDVNFKGANLFSIPQPFAKFPDYYNYYFGSEPSAWHTGVSAFGGVLYPSFYEGIDLKVYSQGSQVKYDFIVKPNADANQISFGYDGADDVSLTEGDLVISTPFVTITEKRPVAFQFIDGKKVLVRCEYSMIDGNVFFEFPDGYDTCHELVIDPLLIFSTYSGSTADNWGSTATPGEHGTLYSAGAANEQNGGNFPATAGAFQTTYGGSYDVAILKYDSLGRQLIYASYLGGEFEDSAHSLVMDSNGDLIVFGTTGSFDFPVSSNAFDQTYNGGQPELQVYVYQTGSDIFVSRISSDGKVLKGSTFLGGTNNDGLTPLTSPLYKNYGDGMRGDVIVDADHNIYLSTVTTSTDFPVVGMSAHHGGITDALVVKLSADLGSLIFSTYVGGTDDDAAYSIKLDSDLDIYVAGGTSSSDFPTTAGAAQATFAGDVDGWIAKLSKPGDAILLSTLTGKASYDQVFFLDLDSDDNAYVFGQTTSPDFAIMPGDVFHENNGGQFVQMFSHDLSTLVISTTFGSGRGEPDISPTAFLVNDCQNIFLAGWGGNLNNFNQTNWGRWQNSSTLGLSVTDGALKDFTSGNDFYLMVLNNGMTEQLYATWFGGTSSTTHVDGGTSRFDKNGIVYQAVCASCGGQNNDFPTTPGVVSRTNNSFNCNNLAFKLDLSSLKAIIQPNNLAMNMPGISEVCFPDTLVFENLSLGGEHYFWDMGDGRKFSTENRNPFQHFYKQRGVYTVWLKAVDAGTCKVKDSVSVKITVDGVDGDASDDQTICENSSTQLQATGGGSYTWTNSHDDFDGTGSVVTVSPTQQTDYYVTIHDSNSGCFSKDTVRVDVIPLTVPEFDLSRTGICTPVPIVTATNFTDMQVGEQFYFDFGDGFTSDKTTVSHQYETDGIYTVKLVTIRESCASEKAIEVPVFRLRVPNVITPKLKDGNNDAFRVFVGEEGTSTPGDFGFNVSLVVYNRWGKEMYKSGHYKNDWTADALEPGVYFFELNVEGYAACKSWLEVIR